MKILLVFIGGFAGAICRFLMSEFIHSGSAFPLGTFIINLIGCFFLAWFLTIATNRMNVEFILFLGTGFTGAFTTFSTFSVEIVRLLEAGELAVSLAYTVLSVVGGVLLSYLGFRIASFMKKRAKWDFLLDKER